MFPQHFRTPLALLAATLLLGLSILGFLHAVVPHTHANEGAEHAELATGLHVTLGKKELVSVALELGSVLFVVLAFECLRAAPHAFRFAVAPPGIEPLRRGILAYRRFG